MSSWRCTSRQRSVARDVRAAADAHQLERADRVDQTAVMHVQPGRAKHAAEQQHVAGDGHDVPHVPRVAPARGSSIAWQPLAANRLDVFLILEEYAERLLDGRTDRARRD